MQLIPYYQRSASATKIYVLPTVTFSGYSRMSNYLVFRHGKLDLDTARKELVDRYVAECFYNYLENPLRS